jgi:hypothetical protein
VPTAVRTPFWAGLPHPTPVPCTFFGPKFDQPGVCQQVIILWFGWNGTGLTLATSWCSGASHNSNKEPQWVMKEVHVDMNGVWWLQFVTPHVTVQNTELKKAHFSIAAELNKVPFCVCSP